MDTKCVVSSPNSKLQDVETTVLEFCIFPLSQRKVNVMKDQKLRVKSGEEKSLHLLLQV